MSIMFEISKMFSVLNSGRLIFTEYLPSTGCCAIIHFLTSYLLNYMQ